ncbi:dTDP-4-dehydrorhamnose reductase [Duncaniella muricolitica]|jgi:dTDP-4-dehydrorhamnose reductase|uniref:dTDP-4-dehydrorhamnose reductase n=1 Tax=Duncaniella muricolitica TaxID=2880704 RepID=UPI00244E5875|nr:dTDP-4-dehydrorhamnose reductase [Duncaniella muricolitica]
MNILVTGANGQLGTALRNSSANSVDKYIFTDVTELDITDAEAVKKAVTDNGIDVIVNCAAYTNVDKAEDDAQFAELLNATAVRNLAEAVKLNDGTLIHVSTDYVFGKEPYNVPCREDQTGTPTGVYGLTKLHGEQEIKKSGVKALIFRTAWLYSEYGRNFVKTMLNLTSTKPELKVVFDQTGTPTYAQDLADAIFHIIENRMINGNEGIYHYSNEGVCSWFDFTKIIAELAGNTQCDIQPCHSSEFPSKVVRPSYSVLDKTKFKETFGIKVPYWTDSLKKCIKNLKENEA